MAGDAQAFPLKERCDALMFRELLPYRCLLSQGHLQDHSFDVPEEKKEEPAETPPNEPDRCACGHQRFQHHNGVCPLCHCPGFEALVPDVGGRPCVCGHHLGQHVSRKIFDVYGTVIGMAWLRCAAHIDCICQRYRMSSPLHSGPPRILVKEGWTVEWPERPDFMAAERAQAEDLPERIAKAAHEVDEKRRASAEIGEAPVCGPGHACWMTLRDVERALGAATVVTALGPSWLAALQPDCQVLLAGGGFVGAEAVGSSALQARSRLAALLSGNRVRRFPYGGTWLQLGPISDAWLG